MPNPPVTLASLGNRDAFIFNLPKDAPLSWAAFGVETGVLWIMGRSCFRVGIICDKSHMNDATDAFCYFAVKPLDPITSGLKWSNAVHLSTLIEQKSFPIRLTKPFKQSTDIPQTIIHFNWHDDVASLTLGWIGYGLADIAIDLFKRGATKIHAQYSLTATEIWTDLYLSESELKDFTNTRTPDYEPSDTVESLCP